MNFEKSRGLADENTVLRTGLTNSVARHEELLRASIRAEYFESLTYRTTLNAIDENIRCIEECLANSRRVRDTIVHTHTRARQQSTPQEVFEEILRRQAARKNTAEPSPSSPTKNPPPKPTRTTPPPSPSSPTTALKPQTPTTHTPFRAINRPTTPPAATLSSPLPKRPRRRIRCPPFKDPSNEPAKDIPKELPKAILNELAKETTKETLKETEKPVQHLTTTNNAEPATPTEPTVNHWESPVRHRRAKPAKTPALRIRRR